MFVTSFFRNTAMISLISLILFIIAVKSANPFVAEQDEPPPGVEKTLLNSKSMRDKFLVKVKENDIKKAETDKIINKEKERLERLYQRRLKRMTPEEQEQRKTPNGLKELQEERIKGYKKSPRLITKEELKEYVGDYPDLPVMVSCKGRVYDVTASNAIRTFGSYSFFAGRDTSRAYALADFANANIRAEDDLEGLTAENMKRLDKWIEYFEGRDDYYFVGLLSDYKYAKEHNNYDPSSGGIESCSLNVLNDEVKKEEYKPWF